ncbi:MBL fold metallo-hydrolase [Tuwongella immobilis]|uniref:Metallo-beta-lactamase domain-containing protein n=1 Tax=Tuwongella immobilis TaxID=692036 RepID=A0A6C2YW25_9BACT|nr:MBL fold metallo-hydrolase [Tuwongella immobilis]VIP05716.1 Metal-dependent hydrolase, beta-lactamase superfamily I OS=Singulisphaera acidiphila (strain ATCC BAA-1392 / DSM 18658 / VKM B-2454 / MOB10) GN=Sinac_5179 PE=4 SV=1: Lactamase_B_2 [Tuwongella immobilis]VTS08788.1 Metal-dependent hydrolase, beta-lactamase superfamily I OS=Singulisphaera acidiphila (strain ATCC BAA-1392 / DSM 18658 / VKM B-2454 / MOB10) GN=Sinac_5179 PE=4 SV=1: Lactamase_B_2 [Tuwongella immobilis]
MAGPRTITFLGTGTSVGVPMIGCDCAVCRSTNPKNSRYRSSVLFRLAEGNLLIDTGPELRLQLLRERVELVHAIAYTHYHADHLFGLDDVRLFPRLLGGPLPIYCTEEVECVIRTAFPYAFAAETEDAPAGFVPKLIFRRLNGGSFDALGERITPIPLVHSRFTSFGYRIGDLAYCTDCNRIPTQSWDLLEGLDTLIIDCLRFKPHPAHLGLDEALDIIRTVRPKRAFLTHMSHEFDYDSLPRMLPSPVQMAYDGLTLEF